jgi:hypothetical protein
VTMDRRQVDVPVIGAMAIQVMDFDPVLRPEKESAGFAASFLFLQ